MAKPIRIAGLLRRTPIEHAASKLLRAVLLDLLEKVPEARSGGSRKGIHNLRVAVKRFREVFRLFRPVLRKKTFRQHREWLEDLNDALGEVRDRDVALVQLEKLTAGLAERPRSVADLPARLESERRGEEGVYPSGIRPDIKSVRNLLKLSFTTAVYLKVKKSHIVGAVEAAPGSTVTPKPSSIRRSTLSC